MQSAWSTWTTPPHTTTTQTREWREGERRGKQKRGEKKRGGEKRERSSDPKSEGSQRDRNSLVRFRKTRQERAINRNPRKKGKLGQTTREKVG